MILGGKRKKHLKGLKKLEEGKHRGGKRPLSPTKRCSPRVKPPLWKKGGTGGVEDETKKTSWENEKGSRKLPWKGTRKSHMWLCLRRAAVKREGTNGKKAFEGKHSSDQGEGGIYRRLPKSSEESGK